MKKIFLLLFVLVSAVAFHGCSENDDNNPNPHNGNFSDNFGSSVSRDFIGRVTDESGAAIQNATIKIGTSTAMTDENGMFLINDANVYERFAYVTATKAGFMDGSRSIVPVSGRNHIDIMLVSSTPVGVVTAGETGTVTMPSGTKVVFDGGFKDESGNSYSGDVSVSMYHLMPSNANLSKLMPGMLYAEDDNGEEAILQTWGMLNVELRGSAGQKLQIADGHSAEITMMIDDSQLASAPSTIPLWHFDSDAGYWIQDGAAVRQGNKYVGSVSHFSWWNCDAYQSVVQMTVTVNDQNGNPIANAGVGLTAGTMTSYIQSTSDNGQVSGVVPANQAMTLAIYDACGNSVYTANIGPFSTDTVLPPITVTTSMAETTTIDGTLMQCDNSPVTNGYIILNYGTNQSYASVSDGNFSFHVLVCNSSSGFTLEGFDYDNLQTTTPISFTFATPSTNVGNILTCTAAGEFVTWQLDGGATSTIIGNINAGIGSQGTTNGFYISGYTPTQNGLYIMGGSTVPGVYTTADQFMLENSQIGAIGTSTVNDIVFTLSNYGAIGEYIDITFSGSYTNATGTHTINGIAHVIRDN